MQTEGKNGGCLETRQECDNSLIVTILFWRYSVKEKSAQFIHVLFPLVISTVKGTYAVVAT